MAKALESQGAKVYITGRRQEKLDEAVKQAIHGNIRAIRGSITSREDVQRAVDVVTEETGYIDLLVCNAGQTTFDTKVWRNCLETKVAAVFTTTMAFLELLGAGNQRRDSSKPTSQVIAIGSLGGLLKASDSFIYNASKAAVHHMMKNSGNFLVPHDIRTNVIAPGWFPSDMTASASKTWDHPGGVLPRAVVPRQRMGLEEELAGTLLYLMMVTDGGFLANHAGTC
ncbi:hypothetical protein CERZMDRAFT_111259 [Cercospora zeae-maydis SCOH1-5]|uniref:NAD(P)-binding protein n=1 Tax=Cercospora zeae-maydis SCOH1-5 TaxID=717836 RepID=A0A6A6FJJ5_9PEZI|nr:hypothetical protein CERZMDRAFT_111259 [Cercospora zeae-maydis SCOH1-5]